LEKVNEDWIGADSKKPIGLFQASDLLEEMGININLDAVEIAATKPVASAIMNCIGSTTGLVGIWLLVTEKYEFVEEDSSIKSCMFSSVI